MTKPRVHFIRGGASYLPELQAYAAHLAALGHESTVHADAGTVPADAQVLWWICGRVPRDAAARWPRAYQVHEYASASVPPAAALKDRVKRWTHPRPQHRVFQSDWVRERMGFIDDVPWSLRDMGVPQAFFEARAAGAPEFDLVYLGETTRLAAFAAALAAIRDAGLGLLVVGAMDDSLRAAAGHATCTGRIAQDEVPAQLLRARAGLNLMPGRLPFSEQTSTKVLEYLAVGLPVVGNGYPWFERAAREHAGRLRSLEVADANAWRTAMASLPPREEDRSQRLSLAWDARLRGLPVWSALP
ncbi:glycosyltransferase [Ramlibacter sp. PS4R-6]|uniref:glycosyltransferase n=1 Tax=Ramlibacter sp. PS4R-6 TaxID=3133438 RepID=UPI0030A58F3F